MGGKCKLAGLSSENYSQLSMSSSIQQLEASDTVAIRFLSLPRTFFVLRGIHLDRKNIELSP